MSQIIMCVSMCVYVREWLHLKAWSDVHVICIMYMRYILSLFFYIRYWIGYRIDKASDADIHVDPHFYACENKNIKTTR